MKILLSIKDFGKMDHLKEKDISISFKIQILLAFVGFLIMAKLKAMEPSHMPMDLKLEGILLMRKFKVQLYLKIMKIIAYNMDISINKLRFKIVEVSR
jgi:hypothetical protein